MKNCLYISNKELNNSGLKPDLSIEIYVYNLMFWGHGYRKSFGHRKFSFANKRKECLSIIELYLFSLYSYWFGEIDF
jgi:hypothetical protein